MFKRILSIVFTLLTSFTIVTAEDFSKLSTSELNTMITKLQNEVYSRTVEYADNKIVYNNGEFQIVLEDVEFNYGDIKAYCRVINNSDSKYEIFANGNSTANGWTLTMSVLYADTEPGQKRKDAFFWLKDVDEFADISSLTELETVTLNIRLRLTDHAGNQEWVKLAPVYCIYSPENGFMVIPQ